MREFHTLSASPLADLHIYAVMDQLYEYHAVQTPAQLQTASFVTTRASARLDRVVIASTPFSGCSCQRETAICFVITLITNIPFMP